MKLKHQFEWREGESWVDLFEVMNRMPESAINIKMGFETEWRGYGPNESEVSFLVLEWETE